MPPARGAQARRPSGRARALTDAGDACERRTLATTTVAESDAEGPRPTPAPRAWAYVRFEADADAAAAGVVVSFRHSGGTPCCC